jgi:hypothetical protein
LEVLSVDGNKVLKYVPWNKHDEAWPGLNLLRIGAIVGTVVFIGATQYEVLLAAAKVMCSVWLGR